METFWKQYLIAGSILTIGVLLVLTIHGVPLGDLTIAAVGVSNLALLLLAVLVGKFFGFQEHS